MLGRLIPLVLVTLILLATLRALHLPWWERKRLRYGIVGVAVMTAAGIAVRSAAMGRNTSYEPNPALAMVGSLIGGAGAVFLLSLLLTVPLAGLVRFFSARLLRETQAPTQKPEKTPAEAPVEAPVEAPAEAAVAAPAEAPASPSPAVSRRRIIEAASLALPATGLGLGAAGIAGAFVPTAIVKRPISYANLPAPLRGLKILQLTDVHLGAFMDPAGVADIVERAREHRPDLVVLTGDFCDHLPYLEPALRAVETLDPRLGIFACMGNHEHYRGAFPTRRIYAKTRIELLDDAHRILDVDGARLVVSGIDDPVGSRQRGDHSYERAIDNALSGAPSDAFHLGLSHRPKGFVALASRGIDLTLSGHTHGAQLGAGERSLFEPFAEGAFLRGEYEQDGKRLYTSSGAGHWLAFRLDCPSEAALVTLENA